jgi:hypothetical protein
MAIGDLAASKGLATYTSAQASSLGYQNDNQRGDDIAATMLRLDTVEAAVNQPIFSVKRGTPVANIAPNTWTLATQAFAVNAEISSGFTWDNVQGTLTVSKAGYYRIGANVFFATYYQDVGLSVVRNSTDPGAGLITANFALDRSVAATGLVRLAAGDVIRLYVIQRNNSGAVNQIGQDPHNMTLTAEWLRA